MKRFLQRCLCLLAITLGTQGAANENTSVAPNSTDSWLFNSTLPGDDDNTTYWITEEEEDENVSSRINQTLPNFEEIDISSTVTSVDETTNLALEKEHKPSMLFIHIDNENATEHSENFENLEQNQTPNILDDHPSELVDDETVSILDNTPSAQVFTVTSKTLSEVTEPSPDLDSAAFHSSSFEPDAVTTANIVLGDNATSEEMDDNTTVRRNFVGAGEQPVSDIVEEADNNATPVETVEQILSTTSASVDNVNSEERSEVTTVSTSDSGKTTPAVAVNHPTSGRDLMENGKRVAESDFNINLSVMALNNFQNHWTSRESSIVDRWCMDCLCQASSGCENIDCSQGLCGPYQISKEYWTDAGKPGFYVTGDPRAFQACALNKTCAELTVRLYMSKFRRDCDQNGAIDCWDFARIHRAGPHNCRADWVEKTPFWWKFVECQEELEAVRPGNNGQAAQSFRPPLPLPENHPKPVAPESLPVNPPEDHPTPIESHPAESSEEQLLPAESIPQVIPDVSPMRPMQTPEPRPTRPHWDRPKPANTRPLPLPTKPVPTRPVPTRPVPTRPVATRPPHNIEPIWTEPIKRIVHQPCLDCICQAMSGCQTRECDANVCGAYQISRPYWQDAGKPGPARRDHPHDFQLCAWNKTCSEVAIQRYMNRFRRDCNSDGVIDCFDFARIHKAGPWACDSPWIESHAFWAKFLQCTASWHAPAPADNAIQHGASSENMGIFHPPEHLPETRPPTRSPTRSPTRPPTRSPTRPRSTTSAWKRPTNSRPRPVVSGTQNRPAWASRPNVLSLDKNRLPWQERQQHVESEASSEKPWDWNAAQHEEERDPSSLNERHNQKLGSDIPSGFWRDSFNTRVTAALPVDHSEEESTPVMTALPVDHSEEERRPVTTALPVDHSEEESRPSHFTPSPSLEGDTSKTGNTEEESLRVEEDFQPPTETQAREFPTLQSFENRPPFRPLFRPNSRLPSLSDLKLAPPSGLPENSDESAHSEENDTNPEDRLLQATDADHHPDATTSAGPFVSVEDLTEESLQGVVSESAPLFSFNPSTRRPFFESDVVNPVDRMCMDCICEATSNCAALGCTRGLCGPYAISLEYWTDAGGRGGRQDFERCATNKSCSEEMVQGYIAKSIRDCDKDGEINCWDFARMHTAGLHNCDAPWIDSTPYWTRFLQCQARNSRRPSPHTPAPADESREILYTELWA